MIKIFIGHTDCSLNSSPRDYINLKGTAQQDKTENMYTEIIKELLITELKAQKCDLRGEGQFMIKC